VKARWKASPSAASRPPRPVRPVAHDPTGPSILSALRSCAGLHRLQPRRPRRERYTTTWDMSASAHCGGNELRQRAGDQRRQVGLDQARPSAHQQDERVPQGRRQVRPRCQVRAATRICNDAQTGITQSSRSQLPTGSKPAFTVATAGEGVPRSASPRSAPIGAPEQRVPWSSLDLDGGMRSAARALRRRPPTTYRVLLGGSRRRPHIGLHPERRSSPARRPRLVTGDRHRRGHHGGRSALHSRASRHPARIDQDLNVQQTFQWRNLATRAATRADRLR